jgi:DNA mismatch repair protein MutS
MNQLEPGSVAGAADAPAPGAGEAARITPMMEQYVEIRAANPDCLLFYRMGDFYELFFDDAVTASRALGIALTKRGKHLGQDIAMCGVPVHAADDYLQKLIGLGYRVAVCEQTEDPAEARRRGSKSVVRRAVTRLVTPGTLTESTLLDSRRNNFSPRWHERRRAAAIRTGLWHGSTYRPASSARRRPGRRARPLAGHGGAARNPGRGPMGGRSDCPRAVGSVEAALTPLPGRSSTGGSAEQRLCTAFGVKSMEAFGAFLAPGACRRRGPHRLCWKRPDRPAALARAAQKIGRQRVHAPGRRDPANLELFARRRAPIREACSPPSTGRSPPLAPGC